MIYSVVPEELAPELYEKLVAYYKDDPHVTVIIDRRKRDRRGRDGEPPVPESDAQRRELRDRRRSRITGEFPSVDAE